LTFQTSSEDLLNQIEDLGKILSAIQPATVTFDEFPSLPPMSMYRRSLDSMPSYWDDSPSRRETRPPTNENCAYNARSPHLKCTVHPIGSCDGCEDFEQAEDIIPNRIPPELTRSERFDELGQVVGKLNVATMISHTLNEPILNNERGVVEMDLEDLQIEPELMEILNRIDRNIFMQGLEELHEFEKPIEPQTPQNLHRPHQNP
jgi:hypothetical protein